ncbi:Mitochondrial ATPase complex subunit atp10 [Batrachochytrium dendrobatidis]
MSIARQAIRLVSRKLEHQHHVCIQPSTPILRIYTIQYRSMTSTLQPKQTPTSDFDSLQNRVVHKANIEISAASTPTPTIDINSIDASTPTLRQPPVFKGTVNLLDRLDSQRSKRREAIEHAKQAQKLLDAQRKSKPLSQRTPMDFINQDENTRDREKLVKEAFSGGYWKDLREVSRKGAKLWEAPEKIRSGQYSHLVPNVSGTLMNGEKTDIMSYVSRHKVTLVVFFFNAFGEQQTRSFVNPFMQEFKTHSDIDLLIVNVEEKLFRAPVLWLSRPYVKWNVPKELRQRYMIHYGDMKDKRTECGMVNTVLGWVNLVDSSGKIRWQAHGEATPKELAAVSNLAKTMLHIL